MIRPPPISPPLPLPDPLPIYSSCPCSRHNRAARRRSADSTAWASGLDERSQACYPSQSTEAHSARGKAASVSDRKSTRLNSSHLVISYAVFCLKKKTTTEFTL